MKNLKILKLIKYSLQFKFMCGFTIFFLVFGIVFELTDFKLEAWSLGGLYLALAGMYIFQMIFTVSFSQMVQTSYYKKKLQTSLPILSSTILSLIFFTVFWIIRIARTTPERLEENHQTYAGSYTAILMSAVSISIFMIYMGFSYKKYILSIILLMVLFIVFAFFMHTNDFLRNVTEHLISGSNPTLLLAVSYSIILVSAFIGYGVNCLLYKTSISEAALRYSLKMAKSK